MGSQRRALLLVLIGVAGLTYLAVDFLAPAGDHRAALATPEDMGLNWQECEATATGFPSWSSYEACFGHPMASFDLTSTAGLALGASGRPDDLELTVGTDVYRTRRSPTFLDSITGQTTYTLSRNDMPVASLSGRITGHYPNLGLRSLGGKVAWEFGDDRFATVIFDGQDLRSRFGVEKAHVPHLLNGKLIFVGEREGKRFVVFDGQEIGPAFDNIVVAHCCEAGLNNVRRSEGTYTFLGEREGRQWIIEITPKE